MSNNYANATAHADAIYGDLTGIQLRMLGGIMGMTLPVQADTSQLCAALGVGENDLVRTQAVQTIRDWLAILGAETSGTRPVLVTRLYRLANPDPTPNTNQGNPQNPQGGTTANTEAISNPRDISIKTLDSALDGVKVQNWLDDISAQSEIRVPGFTTGIMKPILEGHPIPANATPRDLQLLNLLYRGVRASLGGTLESKVGTSITRGEVDASAAGIIVEVQRLRTYYESVVQERARSKLKSISWQKTKGDLLSFQSELEKLAIQTGDPAGETRSREVRDQLIRNISPKNQDMMSIIRRFRLEPASKTGYGPAELAEQLAKVIALDGTGDEEQAQVFGAIHVDAHALTAKVKELDAKLKNEKNTITQLRKSKETENTFFGNYKAQWKGNQGGFHHNKNWNKQGKGGKGVIKDGWSATFCKHCHRHFKSLGLEVTKRAAIISHNSEDCKRESKDSKKSGKKTSKGGGKKK